MARGRARRANLTGSQDLFDPTIGHTLAHLCWPWRLWHRDHRNRSARGRLGRSTDDPKGLGVIVLWEYYRVYRIHFLTNCVIVVRLALCDKSQLANLGLPSCGRPDLI